MNVTAGAGSHRPQEIPRHHYIRRRAAYALGRIRRNPARPVGAKPAAHPLQSETALGFLTFHPVMRGFHRQIRDKIPQHLIRAGACGTSVYSLNHFKFSPPLFIPSDAMIKAPLQSSPFQVIVPRFNIESGEQ
jgi:hypothetical protein